MFYDYDHVLYVKDTNARRNVYVAPPVDLKPTKYHPLTTGMLLNNSPILYDVALKSGHYFVVANPLLRDYHTFNWAQQRMHIGTFDLGFKDSDGELIQYGKPGTPTDEEPYYKPVISIPATPAPLTWQFVDLTKIALFTLFIILVNER